MKNNDSDNVYSFILGGCFVAFVFVSTIILALHFSQGETEQQCLKNKTCLSKHDQCVFIAKDKDSLCLPKEVTIDKQ